MAADIAPASVACWYAFAAAFQLWMQRSAEDIAPAPVFSLEELSSSPHARKAKPKARIAMSVASCTGETRR